MKEYEMPGNVGVITGQVGTDGSLTLEQMNEMKQAGWEFASHGTRNESLKSLSTQEMWLAINDASDWLASNGFTEGNESFVYPHGEYDDNILEFVRRKHSMGFRYMDPLSAASGRITDPLTIGRGDATYSLNLSKTMVNYAEQFHNITVLAFHGITNDRSRPKSLRGSGVARRTRPPWWRCGRGGQGSNYPADAAFACGRPGGFPHLRCA